MVEIKSCYIFAQVFVGQVIFLKCSCFRKHFYKLFAKYESVRFLNSFIENQVSSFYLAKMKS
jgi:hypothetical protein